MFLTFMTSFQALEDLKNVEAAFADVHRKYERTKQVVEGFKHNEDQLKVGANSFPWSLVGIISCVCSAFSVATLA